MLSSPTTAAGEATLPSALGPASPLSIFSFPLSPWPVASYPPSLCPKYSAFFLSTWPASHRSHPSVLFSQSTLNFFFTTLGILCTFVFSCVGTCLASSSRQTVGCMAEALSLLVLTIPSPTPAHPGAGHMMRDFSRCRTNEWMKE